MEKYADVKAMWRQKVLENPRFALAPTLALGEGGGLKAGHTAVDNDAIWKVR